VEWSTGSWGREGGWGGGERVGGERGGGIMRARGRWWWRRVGGVWVWGEGSCMDGGVGRGGYGGRGGVYCWVGVWGKKGVGRREDVGERGWGWTGVEGERTEKWGEGCGGSGGGEGVEGGGEVGSRGEER